MESDQKIVHYIAHSLWSVQELQVCGRLRANSVNY